jgi:hypothetical protein
MQTNNPCELLTATMPVGSGALLDVIFGFCIINKSFCAALFSAAMPRIAEKPRTRGRVAKKCQRRNYPRNQTITTNWLSGLAMLPISAMCLKLISANQQPLRGGAI